MALRDLRIFISVYDARNVLRASVALRMSQSSVSTRIANLEEKYGELFLRLPRGMMPTEKAHTLYRYAQRILALHEETGLAVRETKDAA